MRYIGFIVAGNRDTDRPARPVTNQMQLTIQPAFGQPYRPPVTGVFFTPFAAIRWVLTCVASTARQMIAQQSIRGNHQGLEIGVFLCQSFENSLKNACLGSIDRQVMQA